MTISHQREFGFLITPIEGNFDGGAVSPIDNHAERADWFTKRSNRDGFFYPPQVATFSIDPLTPTSGVKVDRSERPASVYTLPASHTLRLESPLDTSRTTCSDDALIIYLLAYIYGTRLQFSDWRFEGRVPSKPTNNISISTSTCLDFISHTYRWWRSQDAAARTRLINVLYVLTRASSLEWEWDAFASQYMVFDAIYKLHMDLHQGAPGASRHRERFDVLFDAYGIRRNEGLIEKIWNARNELFHEAMWTGSSIGFGSQDQEAYYLPHHLERLNARLVCGLVGYNNEYSTSAWWAMGTFLFDKRM